MIELAVAFMETVVLCCLALGATFSAWTLQACLDLAAIVCRRFWPQMLPSTIGVVGTALFLVLLLGCPVIAIGIGYITGHLPGKPS